MYLNDLENSEPQPQHLIITLSEKHVCLNWQDKLINLNRTQSWQYLIELLLHPYQSISATSLFALCHYNPAKITPLQVTNPDAGITINGFHSILSEHTFDAQAIAEIKKRLQNLREQIEEAEQWCDLKRLEDAKAEYEALTDYLKAAIVEQRKRFIPCEADIKCTENIYHALTYLLQVIGKHDTALQDVLKSCLRLWSELMYIPLEGLQVTVIDK